MKRFGLILVALVGFALAGESRGQWFKTRTQADKVEQTLGSEVYYYRNNEVEIFIDQSKRSIAIIPLLHRDWQFLSEALKRNLNMSAMTVATFDLRDNRTGYYDNLLALQLNDKSTMIFEEPMQVINENAFSKILDYLVNSSGSVIFRLRDVNEGNIDYEVETIKTLGYENTINGKHVDGDVDVLGL